MNIEELKNKYRLKNKQLIYSYNNGYIGKNTYQVTLKDGTIKKIEQIIKANLEGNATVIIPITEQNRFVVIIESRPNTKEGVLLEFPAGMLDPNENYLEAAKRELLEETGYTSETFIELESHYQDQGCSSAIIKTYVALNCKKIQKQKLDEHENITSIEIEESELNRLFQNNELKDANTKIAYLTYKLKKGNLI